MPNQIDGSIKEERSRKLIELSDKNEKEYNEQIEANTKKINAYTEKLYVNNTK